ncbi:MAG: Crp/Fnr family transcriptional regulator [Eubacteriaceae bacterium]|nr:Crp/Fnr family transcriptional regulator [Eubacteriaceae bacterium]
MEVRFINIDNYIDIIASLDLFCGFTKDDLKRIFSLLKYDVRVYNKDQIIHLQNERCDTMDIIVNGQVAVQHLDENGNILLINIFLDGDILGANLMFSSRNNYPMTVVAQTKVVILHIHKELVLELCQRNNDFMIGLMTAISDRTLILTDKINAIALKTIRQCIIDFLRYEYHIQKTNVIKLEISKKDFAERLGIQRTSLSRELNKMRKDGLLEYDSKTITIKDSSNM